MLVDDALVKRSDKSERNARTPTLGATALKPGYAAAI
jgi:hypothetical protein